MNILEYAQYTYLEACDSPFSAVSESAGAGVVRPLPLKLKEGLALGKEGRCAGAEVVLDAVSSWFSGAAVVRPRVLVFPKRPLLKVG